MRALFKCLEKDNRDFTSFIPSKDLFDNLCKMNIIPHTMTSSQQWHWGICPMAFTLRNMAELVEQRAAYSFGNHFKDKIFWTVVDQKCLKSAPPKYQ